jgi:hypothetical protein
MPTRSAPGIEDIARIAFVTRRFHELKGLKTASFGMGLLAGCLVYQWQMVSGRHLVGPLQIFITGNIVQALSSRELDRRYRETFGDPVASTGARVDRVGWDALVGVVLTSGALADSFVRANGRGPSVAALLLASWSLFIVVRDWPRRIHHLTVVVASVAAAVVTAAVLPVTKAQWSAVDPARAPAFLLAYALLGIGLVAAGLLDHHLLASSLRPAHPPAEKRLEDRVGRRDLTRALIAGLFCVGASGSLWWFSPLTIGLGFPLVLVIAGALGQLVLSIRDIRLWSRSVNHGECVPVDPLRLDTHTLALMFAVAVAAAVDCTLGSPPVPMALAGAIGAWSAWVAVRDWRDRQHYLIGAMASIVGMLVIGRGVPARGFAVLVCATAGALTAEFLLDWWKARRPAEPAPCESPGSGSGSV